METTPRSHSNGMEAGLERLRRDLAERPTEPDQTDESPDRFSDLEPIDYAAMEFEVERLRKRLAIWEIFLGYVRDGARTWPDVQRAVTPEDLDHILDICDGVPLRDILLHLR